MSDKKKVLRMDQAVLLGASAFILGLTVGMFTYHFIAGSPAPAKQQEMSQASLQPPPTVAPPAQNMPDYSVQIREIRSVVERDPANRAAWVELGNLYFDSNRPQESVEAYSKALAINSNDANVLTDRGIMYRTMENIPAALADFRKAAQIDPNHYQCLYNEGITLLHNMNDQAGALKAWEAMMSRNVPPDVAAQMKTRIDAVREMLKKK